MQKVNLYNWWQIIIFAAIYTRRSWEGKADGFSEVSREWVFHATGKTYGKNVLETVIHFPNDWFISYFYLNFVCFDTKTQGDLLISIQLKKGCEKNRQPDFYAVGHTPRILTYEMTTSNRKRYLVVLFLRWYCCSLSLSSFYAVRNYIIVVNSPNKEDTCDCLFSAPVSHLSSRIRSDFNLFLFVRVYMITVLSEKRTGMERCVLEHFLFSAGT